MEGGTIVEQSSSPADLIEPIATGLLVAVLVALQPNARSVPLRVFLAMAGMALIGVVAGTWR